MKIRRLVVGTLAVFFAAVVVISVSASSSPTTPLTANASNLVSCQQIITQAIDMIQNSCGQLGRNKACYGYSNVKAEPNGNLTLKFDKIGDVAGIETLRSIETSPLNLTAGTWGLTLLKLQANLPDMLPGQNVTFLVYGNTHIDNTSSNMRSFYFSSGLGAPDCKETPHDGILVKSPNHAVVTFTANGVDITIASTIQLHAEASKAMTVSLIEGHATVTTFAGSQTLLPGQTVSIPLAGSNGLTASGAPSKPVTTRSDPTRKLLVNVAEQVSIPAVTVTVSTAGAGTQVAASPVSTVDTVADPSDPNALEVTSINGVITAVHGNILRSTVIPSMLAATRL